MYKSLSIYLRIITLPSSDRLAVSVSSAPQPRETTRIIDQSGLKRALIGDKLRPGNSNNHFKFKQTKIGIGRLAAD